MNTWYLVYQAERAPSGAEQRQIDIARGELAARLARPWHILAVLLRRTRRPEDLHISQRQDDEPRHLLAARG